MNEIDFDALMGLTNLLENGDFSAGNDGSTSRIPGLQSLSAQYGRDYYLDYGPTAAPHQPALTLNRSSSPALLLGMTGVPRGHQVAIVVTHRPHPQGVSRASPISVSFEEADGGYEYFAVEHPGGHGWSRAAFISTLETADRAGVVINLHDPSDQVGTHWLVAEIRMVDLTAAGMDGLPESEEIITEDISPRDITGPDDAGVHEFTRDWWDRLPRYVRDADRQQGPIPVPLLRFLDGAGRQAGRIRDTNNGLWDGALLDPEIAPDGLLPWVAFLLGVTPGQRDLPPAQLRRILCEQVTGSNPGVGTREHIASATRAYLTLGARVQVFSSSTLPWTLIIGVDQEYVPDGDYSRLEHQLREAGVVPAGHIIRAQQVRNTWDQWESTAGETWGEVEGNIRTWSDSESAGVELS